MRRNVIVAFFDGRVNQMRIGYTDFRASDVDLAYRRSTNM